MAWNVDASDAFRVAADFTKAGVAGATRALAITRHYGQLVSTKAKANASGRPGPRAQTGDLRRSITSRTTSSVYAAFGGTGEVAAEVGTNKPQGRRLELGFHGEDSLKRAFEQPPYPFLGPALDSYADDYTRAIATIVDGV